MLLTNIDLFFNRNDTPAGNEILLVDVENLDDLPSLMTQIELNIFNTHQREHSCSRSEQYIALYEPLPVDVRAKLAICPRGYHQWEV